MERREEFVEEVVETTPRRRRVVREADGVLREVVEPVDEVVVEEVVMPASEIVVERPVPVRQRVQRWLGRPVAVERDVVSTEYYTAPSYGYDPALARFIRIMWFALALLEGLLALRFLLALLGANPRNEFAALIYAITWPFVAPFRTLFATPAAGGSVFELYTLMAMLVYFLVWWAIVKLIALIANRPVDA